MAGGVSTSTAGKLFATVCSIADTAKSCANKLETVTGFTPIGLGMKALDVYNLTKGEKKTQRQILETELASAKTLYRLFLNTVTKLADAEKQNQYKLCSSLDLARQVAKDFYKSLEDNFANTKTAQAFRYAYPEWYRQLLTSQVQYLQATMQLLSFQFQTIQREVEAAKSIQSPSERMRAFEELAAKYTCRASAAA